MRTGKIIAAAVCALLGLGTLAGCGAANAAQPGSNDKNIAIGYQSGMPSLTIAKEQGELEKTLKAKGYTISWHYFASTSDMVNAAVSSSNNIDFGGGGATASIFGQAANKPIVKVAAQAGVRHGSAVLTRADSGINSVADLKGKKVAVTKGTLQQYVLVAALKQAGLTYSDITPVYIAPSDALAAYKKGGQFDAWATWDPLTAQAEASVPTKTLADNESIWGDEADQQGGAYYFTNSSFVKGHEDVIRDIVNALADATTWYNDNPEEAAKLLSKVYNADYDSLLVAAKRHGTGEISPVTETYLKAYQQQADLFTELKVIPNKIDALDKNYYWNYSA